MKIWITRHGQTKLNKEHLMQGRTDEPLNETGFSQAKAARKMIGDVTFDAVYASPLRRAVDTAVIIGNVPEKDVIIDPRLIEVDFGKYELRPYLHASFRPRKPWSPSPPWSAARMPAWTTS